MKTAYTGLVPSATQVDDVDISDVEECQDAAIVGHPNLNAMGYQRKLEKDYKNLAAILSHPASEDRLPKVRSDCTLDEVRIASRILRYLTRCVRDNDPSRHGVSWGNHYRLPENQHESLDDAAVRIGRGIFMKNEELRLLLRYQPGVLGQCANHVYEYFNSGAAAFVAIAQALSVLGFLTCNRSGCPDGTPQVEKYMCPDPLIVPTGADILYCPDGSKAIRRFHCDPLLVLNTRDDQCFNGMSTAHQVFAFCAYVIPFIVGIWCWCVSTNDQSIHRDKVNRCEDELNQLVKQIMADYPVGNIVPFIVASSK